MSARNTALPEPSVSMLWNRSFATRSAHLVGICGAGMKALAEALHDLGWSISGCDQDPHPPARQSLEQSGISVTAEHHRDHVHSQLQLLIHSPAVAASHPERERAAELGIPQISYVDALAELTRATPTYAIAGTHGKSSTTAMLGAILRAADRKPTVLCGAQSRSLGRNGWADTGRLAVVEACEFRRHFLQLQPASACLLGIEPDHFDCYPAREDAIDAYRSFAEKIPAEGTLVYRSDCAATREAIRPARARFVSFSLDDPGADWQVEELEPRAEGTRFRLRRAGERSAAIQFSVPGRHNVQNALAAAACAGACGLSLAEIAGGLEQYRGLGRRLERLPDREGAIVFDDYAHHPTEVRAAIEAVREAFPDRRIVCVFQPHQRSRTARLLDDFAAALCSADRVYLLPVYAAREVETAASEELSAQILRRLPLAADLIPSLDRVWSTIETDAGTDAVILTLGAGTLSRIHHDFT